MILLLRCTQWLINGFELISVASLTSVASELPHYSTQNYWLTVIHNWLHPLIAPGKVTSVMVTWRLLVRATLLVAGHHCTMTSRDFLLMSPYSHLPQRSAERPSNWLGKPLRQSKENRKAALTTSREPRSEPVGLPSLSACSYSGVNTRIFGIWAKFTASEKAFIMELAV